MPVEPNWRRSVHIESDVTGIERKVAAEGHQVLQ